MIAEKIVSELKKAGTNFFTMLPCEKTKSLSDLVSQAFKHIDLSTEEEGVGICAGAYLAGAKPAMLVQSSGTGNTVNTLCSLTETYELPLPVLVSWRGVHKEEIPAQIPLGKKLPRILEALDIDYCTVETQDDIKAVNAAVSEAYAENKAYFILLNPKLWEEEKKIGEDLRNEVSRETRERPRFQIRSSNPVMTRFEVLKVLSKYLSGRIVVCNLGVPSKELYHVKHQKTNFYMLGSMGLASSIGLGIAYFTQREVAVIDGDGSLLMNLGSLSTVAVVKPKNLTILAIDNGVHGSTGNQPTATSYGTDLELIAKGAGFDKTYKAATEPQILSVIKSLRKGPNFVHILAKPGNAKVPNVPLTPSEIKKNVMEAIQN
jgi:sulfopyruvate decarboxylase subunit beta